jgi:hypothetical protein
MKQLSFPVWEDVRTTAGGFTIISWGMNARSSVSSSNDAYTMNHYNENP